MSFSQEEDTMKKLVTYFLSGLVILVPIFLTLYIAYLAFTLGDAALGHYLKRVLPFYLPGLGFIVLILLVTALGYLGNRLVLGRILAFVDWVFSKLPLLGMVYQTIKTTIENIFGEQKALNNPVYVELGPAKIIGFKTNEIIIEGQRLAVIYVPLSLQMAGHLIYVPPEAVRPCPLSSEDVLKLILSAGLSK